MTRERRRAVRPGRLTRTGPWATGVLVVVLLLIAIFVLQNTAAVHVHFLFWSAHIALSGAILLAAALGVLAGFLVALVRHVQFRRAIRREQQLHPDDDQPASEDAPGAT